MKNTLLLLAVLLLTATKIKAQEQPFKAPNYELIKKEIQDKASNFYYPKLLERLAVNDTLLNKEDYDHLYFGYVFDPKFDAFYKSTDEEKLSEYYRSEKLDEKDYDKIIKLAEHALSAYPFDLRPMNYLAYIYHLKGDEINAKKMAIRFNKILGIILSSGNGLTCETGFHVISVSDEYMLLNTLKLKVKAQSLTGNCDYMSFEKGMYKVDGLYFNIEKILKNEMEHFKKK
jgi:hypothetical protein